jgi:hypothetical protein
MTNLGMVVRCVHFGKSLLHAETGVRRQLPPSIYAARGARHYLHIVVWTQTRLHLAQQGLDVPEPIRLSKSQHGFPANLVLS